MIKHSNKHSGGRRYIIGRGMCECSKIKHSKSGGFISGALQALPAIVDAAKIGKNVYSIATDAKEIHENKFDEKASKKKRQLVDLINNIVGSGFNEI